MSSGSPGPGGAFTASAVTTHVLDTARGQPAAGVAVRLEFVPDDGQPDGRPAGTGRPRNSAGRRNSAGP